MSTYVPIARKFVGRVLLYHSAVASRIGMNVTDVNGLRLLADESKTAGQLSEQLGLTGAATTALIDRLEGAGYVVRERSSDDRRRITVHADPKKLREVNDFFTGQGAQMSKLLSKYTAEEFEVLMDFLEQTTLILAEEAKTVREKA